MSNTGDSLIKGDIRKVMKYLNQTPSDSGSGSLLNMLQEGNNKYGVCKGCGEPVHRHLSFCPYCWTEVNLKGA
ncbi:MAG: hypothetical protein HPY50_04310 [Firmicutes bacterium]|nr:hypothetical protein [Bacillota bacterium]